MKDLEQELEELKANLEGVKGQLEAETLSKVDLQNNIQSLREDLAFKKKMYEEVSWCIECMSCYTYLYSLCKLANSFMNGPKVKNNAIDHL